MEPHQETNIVSKPTIVTKKRKKSDQGIDPVQIALTCGIFFVLFFMTAYMLSWISMMAIGSAAIVTLYQYLLRKKSSTSKNHDNKSRLSFFSTTMIILPILLGTAIAYDGYTVWKSIIQTIMIWGLSITFWSTMLFVPLAVRGRYKEAKQPDLHYHPSISIIVPAYNEEKVIRKTVDSIIHADYPNKEIIVVDDGSKDRTSEIAKSYGTKIKFLHKENGGKASALNYGLAVAKGEIIVVIDADTIIGRRSLLELMKGFSEKNIAAVAGNVRIRNVVNWLTKCQALEYISAIQIMRRALDFFGAITIVPGAIGAFRKSNLEKAGTYHQDTLVEDFDATIKVLKTGSIVTGSINSVAYTEAPQTLRDFFKQRQRWYRGNLQVLFRHSDAITNPRFGFLHKLSFPYMILTMLVLPILGFMIWITAIIGIILGEWFFVLFFTSLFITLQYLLTFLAVRIDGGDPKLAAYAVFFIIGFKQILDVLLIKAVIDTMLKRKASWTSAERIGS